MQLTKELTLDKIKFDEKGLIPAIIQDALSGKVLMLGYMNSESLQKTLETGRTWFYSRSRQKLWNKGETSGHFQDVVSAFYDCDEDTLLFKVKQTGPACHTGNFSCFYRSLIEGKSGNENIIDKSAILREVFEIIEERKRLKPKDS